MTGNWGLAAASVEDMLKESNSRTLGIDDFDEEEMFDNIHEMSGVFKTGLPKVQDRRGRIEAWDNIQPSQLTLNSPMGMRGSMDELDDDQYMRK
jgi:hypothetical protein